MPIHYFQEGLPNFKNAVITIGSFDGVHHGHKKILNTLVEKAREVRGESIVITFDPHPRKVIRPDIPMSLICSTKEKYKTMLDVGVDHIVVVPFTRAFSLLSAHDYIKDFLLGHFNPHTIIIGYDHHFGHDRTGDIQVMRKMVGDTVDVIEIPVQLIEDANVSSTKIRNAVYAGDVKTAAQMLGRPFSFEGVVIHGKQLGRTIGFPTANLQAIFPEQIMPPIGIYAVKVQVDNTMWNGVMSIGKNPTVTTGNTVHYEVYIFDFDRDIYGQLIQVFFIEKIREELKFDNIDELVAQIKKDVQQATAILNVFE